MSAPREDLDKLEEDVEALIRLCEQLHTENTQLRKTCEQLRRDHARAEEKNRISRERLDQLIGRFERDLGQTPER
jgi:uncharacterized protein (TIGR02449 family)